MRPNALGAIGALLFLIVRGALLWFIVPLGALVWLLSFQWIGRERVSLGAFLGWLDNNFAFALVRGLFRPAFPTSKIAWIPARERSQVTHRIGWTDPL